MAQINIRIDDELKARADNIFNELGLNMTTAFTMFIRQTIRQGGIPFEVTTRMDDAAYLNTIPGMSNSIKEGIETPLSECVPISSVWADV
jgi:DNA-damage-inducible protein J